MAVRQLVRSVHRAGPGSLRATLFYPADPAGVDGARLTGIVPPAPGGPRPVVVFMPGINVAPHSYRWLATELASAGLVTALYSLVGDLGPVGPGITPGIDLDALAPGTLGRRPSAVALSDVIDLVAADPLLGDGVDLDRIGLGGHSAGGTLALHNASPDWFPGVRAAFAYAGHTMAATALGHGEAAVMAVPSAVPLLIMAGARDGVIEASRDRYRSEGGRSGNDDGRDGNDPDRHDPVRRTFEEAVTSNRGDCWWVELAAGVHFTPCHPVDHTSGRSFLDPPADPADPPGRDGAGEADRARGLLAELATAFLVEHLADGPSALDDLVTRPGVSNWARR